jgi:signal peptidase I
MMRRRQSHKAKPDKRGTSFITFVLIVAIAAWAFRSFVLAPFHIPSGSMLPSLYIGDYLVAAKWPYGYSRYSFPLAIPSFDGRILASIPERGDVIVFTSPSGQRVDVVKRVIGLPGDRVELRGGELILNGKPVPRETIPNVEIPVSPNSPCRMITGQGIAIASPETPSCSYPAYWERLPNGASYTVIDQVENSAADNFPETLIPAGHLFLMGDNRDDSLDSRFSPIEGGLGFVPLDLVVGRAEANFWSTDGSASYFKPWTWFTALRAERIGKGYSEGQ